MDGHKDEDYLEIGDRHATVSRSATPSAQQLFSTRNTQPVFLPDHDYVAPYSLFKIPPTQQATVSVTTEASRPMADNATYPEHLWLRSRLPIGLLKTIQKTLSDHFMEQAIYEVPFENGAINRVVKCHDLSQTPRPPSRSAHYSTVDASEENEYLMPFTRATSGSSNTKTPTQTSAPIYEYQYAYDAAINDHEYATPQRSIYSTATSAPLDSEGYVADVTTQLSMPVYAVADDTSPATDADGYVADMSGFQEAYYALAKPLATSNHSQLDSESSSDPTYYSSINEDMPHLVTSTDYEQPVLHLKSILFCLDLVTSLTAQHHEHFPSQNTKQQLTVKNDMLHFTGVMLATVLCYHVAPDEYLQQLMSHGLQTTTRHALTQRVEQRTESIRQLIEYASQNAVSPNYGDDEKQIYAALLVGLIVTGIHPQSQMLCHENEKTSTTFPHWAKIIMAGIVLAATACVVFMQVSQDNDTPINDGTPLASGLRNATNSSDIDTPDSTTITTTLLTTINSTISSLWKNTTVSPSMSDGDASTTLPETTALNNDTGTLPQANSTTPTSSHTMSTLISLTTTALHSLTSAFTSTATSTPSSSATSTVTSTPSSSATSTMTSTPSSSATSTMTSTPTSTNESTADDAFGAPFPTDLWREFYYNNVDQNLYGEHYHWCRFNGQIAFQGSYSGVTFPPGFSTWIISSGVDVWWTCCWILGSAWTFDHPKQSCCTDNPLDPAIWGEGCPGL